MKFEKVTVLNYTGKKAHKTLNSEYATDIICHSFPNGKGKEVTWSLYNSNQPLKLKFLNTKVINS